MKGYLFIGNSTKPSNEEYNSLKDVRLSFVSSLPIECAMEKGYKIYAGTNRKFAEKIKCANGYDIEFYNQHTFRSIFAFRDNFVAFSNLYKFLIAHPEISIIHCNTPIGGLVGRACAKFVGGGKTVIYTAHGFHFFKGAPLFNRTIIKWVERFLARWTDAIIVMNKEDFESALRFHLRNNGKVYNVPGVGVDSASFDDVCVDRNSIRDSIGVPRDSIMAIAMGDIVPRKNFKTAIAAIAKAGRPNLHYVICGKGAQIEELTEYSKTLGVEEQIHFLGFRNDIKQLALASDLFLFSSLQEGLPRSTMEAMCAGLPCVISEIRGHVDLIENEKGGILCPVNNVNAFSSALQRIVDDSEFRKEQGAMAKSRIKHFDVKVVKQRLREIFTDILKDK